MVSSLQSIVLYSIPIAVLFELLKILHHLPMGHDCFRALFRRCTHEELRAWAKTLPWTTLSPGNWTTRSIAAVWLVSFMAFIFSDVGPLFLILFLIFYRRI